MLEKLPVDLENLLVIAKKIAQLAEHPAMALPYPTEPSLDKIIAEWRKGRKLCLAVSEPLDFLCHKTRLCPERG